MNAPALQIRLLDQSESVDLPGALVCSAGFVGLDPWTSFVRSVYNFPVYRMVAETNGRIDGWLALVRVNHPVFGDYLATSPFGSYGGFAFASVAARDALLEKALAAAASLLPAWHASRTSVREAISYE